MISMANRRFICPARTLNNCLVNHDRFKRHILCFELKTVEKYDVLERKFSKRLVRDESYLGEGTSEIYIAADVDASWERVKRMCLYSTDAALHST